MNIENQAKAIEAKLVELLAADPGYFVVEVTVRPTNNVKVFIDADQGASIDRLTRLNRALYRHLEESGLFPGGDFSLEVSSPGLEEPLKLDRQYLKNIGRAVEVILKNGIKKEGTLILAGENEIVIREERGKGKRKEFVEHTIPKEEIKTTRIQVKF